MAEEGISELEGISVQTSQTEKQREQKFKNIYIFKNYGTIAKAIIHIMEIPEREGRRKGKINIQNNSD